MAWSQSYIPASTLVSALTGGVALNLSPSNTHLKLALYSNSATPNPDEDPQKYGLGQWASNEITGTNWPAGGVALSLTGAGLSHQSGDFLLLAAVNLSVANTTISTAAVGCLIYDTSLSNLVIAALWFGGSGYTTSSGTFGITWPSSGIFNLPLIAG